MFKIQFRTESGSTYELEGERDGGTWSRLEHSAESTEIRTKDGRYDTFHPYPILIGHSVSIICPKFVPNADIRLIHTSAVTEIILEEKDGQKHSQVRSSGSSSETPS